MQDRISEMHAEICKTLGSPVRIEILNSLRNGEKTVSQISQELGLNQANVSQHLAVLRQRRVVTTRKEGTSVFYGVSNPKIIQACRLMREVLLDQLKETRKLTILAERPGSK
ncbi:MAG TPA: metalloregulator ArsR/SmtB family transcription factor [Nitrososphaerales archaeon]|nr:metalloregulator ArsR/SmtB family transcription factor [Nitrososphaerales archaeon]